MMIDADLVAVRPSSVWRVLRHSDRLKRGAGVATKKGTGLEQLVAVHARGEAYLSPSVADAVLTDYRTHVTNPVDLLTSRERELLHLIAEGSTNKDIANQSGLSVYTVEGHRGRLMEKLNLHSTGDLVRFAIRNGFIS